MATLVVTVVMVMCQYDDLGDMKRIMMMMIMLMMTISDNCNNGEDSHVSM